MTDHAVVIVGGGPSPPTASCGSSPSCTMHGRCYSTSVSPAASTSLHGQIGFNRSMPNTSVSGSFLHSGRSLLPPPCQFGDAPHRALPIRAPAAANNGSATESTMQLAPSAASRGSSSAIRPVQGALGGARVPAYVRPIGPVGQRKHSRRHRQECCRGRDISSWHCCRRTLGKIKAAPGTGARVSLARTEYQMNIRDPEASKRKWPEPKFRPSLNREASRLGDVRVRRPSSRAQVPETCRDQSIASRERWTFERSSTSRNFFWLVCKNCNSLRKLCCVASAEPSFRDFAQ